MTMRGAGVQGVIRDGRRSCAAALALGVLLIGGASPARAHEKKSVGPFLLTIGWGDEPAFAGLKNTIEVHVAGPPGVPLKDTAASLAVEISFGDQRMVLPLARSAERPGTFDAAIIPTRAGTYSLRVTGKLGDQSVDLTSTCSDKTFDCVVDAAAVQFPAKDPPAGQLADGLSRALPRAERALEAAARARLAGFAALALAALALVVSIGSAKRR
jgi:hypothetical protein